jgi:Coenzyme PQQ synthesis protein D (PqqD)
MSAYMIDKSRFVFEQFDKEMVLINLDDGLYFNVSDTGTEVLRLLEQGLSVAEVLDELTAHYSNTDELPALVEGFVAELEEQGILLPQPQGAPMNSQSAELAAARNGTKKCFAPPVLTRFDDMQEILLLDPIHQVSEQGWPNR